MPMIGKVDYSPKYGSKPNNTEDDAEDLESEFKPLPAHVGRYESGLIALGHRDHPIRRAWNNPVVVLDGGRIRDRADVLRGCDLHTRNRLSRFDGLKR